MARTSKLVSRWPGLGTAIVVSFVLVAGTLAWSVRSAAQEVESSDEPTEEVTVTSGSTEPTEEVTVTSGGTEQAAPAGEETTASPVLASPASSMGETPDAETLAADYNRTLRTIETKVNTLKEKVFRSKARLLLLRETVLHGVVSGAKAVLYHVNELGPSYSIESVTYFLDGSKIYSRADATGDLSKKGELKIFEGNVPPGNHQVTVNLVLRGNGFGVFSYLNSYKFKVQHSYNFIAEEGKVSRLRIISYEKNGLMRDFKDRPNIRYDLVTDRNLPSTSESGTNP